MKNESDDWIDQNLKEIIDKNAYLKSIKSVLLSNQTESDQTLHLIILNVHHKIEDTFDCILQNYIGPQHLEQKIIDDIPANLEPREVCKQLIFNAGFDQKTELICEVFGLRESTRQNIKALNKIRNGIAHRYKTNHPYFKYKKKNVLEDYKGLKVFLIDVGEAFGEINFIDELLAKYFEH